MRERVINMEKGCMHNGLEEERRRTKIIKDGINGEEWYEKALNQG